MTHNILNLTPEALNRLKTIYADNAGSKILKIFVTGKGCSGHSYDLQFVEKPEAGDEIVIQDGVQVIVDSKAVLYLIGTTMDFKDDLMESGFKFKNPNVKSLCGCGESFAV